jgi:hypothetical protein
MGGVGAVSTEKTESAGGIEEKHPDPELATIIASSKRTNRKSDGTHIDPSDCAVRNAKTAYSDAVTGNKGKARANAVQEIGTKDEDENSKVIVPCCVPLENVSGLFSEAAQLSAETFMLPR